MNVVLNLRRPGGSGTPMPGWRVAASLHVLVILLVSQGPISALAENSASTDKQEAAGTLANNADWDPVTKLLAWIQQNEGQVRLILLVSQMHAATCVFVCTSLVPEDSMSKQRLRMRLELHQKDILALLPALEPQSLWSLI